MRRPLESKRRISPSDVIAIASAVISAFGFAWAVKQTNVAREQTEIARYSLVSGKRDEAMYDYIEKFDKLCTSLTDVTDGAAFAFEQEDHLITVTFGSKRPDRHGYGGEKFAEILQQEELLRVFGPKMSIWFEPAELTSVKRINADLSILLTGGKLVNMGLEASTVADAYGTCLATKADLISWYRSSDHAYEKAEFVTVNDPRSFYRTVEAF